MIEVMKLFGRDPVDPNSALYTPPDLRLGQAVRRTTVGLVTLAAAFGIGYEVSRALQPKVQIIYVDPSKEPILREAGLGVNGAAFDAFERRQGTKV